MKTFGIYQFFITKNQEEKHLLIGFSSGSNENEAVENFTTDNFKKGYLSAIECNNEDLSKSNLLESIEKNKQKLGVFNN